MRKLMQFACAVTVLLACMPAMAAQDASDLYRAQAIVTGTGEPNRQIGFRKCLEDVLVRVSGDPRLLGRPEMAALRDKAGSFVAEFRYHDRMEGVPIHDEQGSHDRPHDLTCIYRPQTIDKVLTSLGSRPWLAKRPRLLIFLKSQNATSKFALTADGNEMPYMRDSFIAAATPLAMQIVFPSAALLASAKLDVDSLPDADIAALDRLAAQTDAGQALAGSLVWSDKDFGWIADWRLASNGKTYRWQARGISFDEAFRLAMCGAVQILSGNGQP